MCVICFLTLIALNSDESLRFLLLTLAAFWFLNYVIRPLIFMYSVHYNVRSAVYDKRIGENTDLLNRILLIIFLGCVVFTSTQYLGKILVKYRVKKKIRFIEKKHDSETIIFYALFFGVASMILQKTSLQNPVSKSLVILVPLSMAVFLWNKVQNHCNPWVTLTFLLVSSVSILLYSRESGNFKGIILTPALVFIFKMNFWQSQRSRIKKISLLSLLGIGFFPLFTELQRIRLGTTQVDEYLSYQNQLPWYLSPFLNLAVRFDQFARVTDSILAPTGVLGDWKNGFAYMLNEFQLNPSTSSATLTFGQVWNQKVTNQSIPGARFSNVSLGQGMIAEGYVWNGIPTMVATALLVSFTFLIVAKLLRGNLISNFFAFAVIGNATYFEAGIVQMSSNVTSGLKVLLFLKTINFTRRILFPKLVTNSN